MKWEKRTEFIGGVPFTTAVPLPEPGTPVDFDGGARQLPPSPPRVEWARDQSDPAWETVTLEDGASLFFGKLGE